MSTTITKDTECGIYQTKYTAKVETDVVRLTSPYIRWVGNSGNLAFENTFIRDKATVDTIHAALDGSYPDADSYGDGYADAEDFIFRTLIDGQG